MPPLYSMLLQRGQFKIKCRHVVFSLIVFLFGGTTMLGGQAPTKPLTLKEMLRISAASQNLSSIGRVLIGPGGAFAVGQGQDYSVRLFSAKGEPLATIGHKGAGPGEIQRLTSFGWVGDGIWVYDGALKRLTTFSSSGKLIKTVPVASAPESTPDRTNKPMYTSLGFQRLGASERILFQAASPVEKGKAIVSFVWGTPTGKVEPPIAELPEDDCIARFANGAVAVPLCFQVSIGIAPMGDRVVFLELTAPIIGTYRLTSIDAGGKSLFRRTYQAPVRRLSKAVADSLARVVANRPALRSVGAKNPEVWPVVRYLFVGDEGTIWVQMSRDAESNTPFEWRGYDASGTPRGVIQLSNDTHLVASDRDHIVVVEVDADGMESIVRYQVVR